MIRYENITGYIHSLEPDRPAWLEALREKATAQGVPIIRPEMEPFLKVLLQMSHPARILEIGTGIGYSALFMDSCLDHPRIITMENYEPRLQEARVHLSGHANIQLLEGDAQSLIRDMQGSFDFIFLDGPKAQYSSMLPDLLRLMEPGSILLADNVLQEGEIVLSRYLIPRRQRTIHARMRAFLWQIKHLADLDSALIPIGDGVVLSRKKS